jgi:hypothetical protein
MHSAIEQRVEARRRILEHEPDLGAARSEPRCLTPFISWPSTCSDPPTTVVRPTIARPIVVLPDPDSPTRPTTSPGATWKSTPLTATDPAAAEPPG